MRSKEEILRQVWANINKAPKETRPMLEHEYCYIEVLIDIRDTLAKWLFAPHNNKEKNL